MSYSPTTGSGSKYSVYLGYLDFNTTTYGGLDLDKVTIDGGGYTLDDSDAGTAIMRIDGIPERTTPLFTKILTVEFVDQCRVEEYDTHHYGSGFTSTLFRKIGAKSGTALVSGSIGMESDLSNGPTLNFTVYSETGWMKPVVGQPILFRDNTVAVSDESGDLFGGSVEQVTYHAVPGKPGAVFTEVQCVGWQSILQRRLLVLSEPDAGTNSDTITITADNESNAYALSAYPTSITSITVNGVAATFGDTAETGKDFFWSLGANWITVGTTSMSVFSPTRALAIGDVIVVAYNTDGGQIQDPVYGNLPAGEIIKLALLPIQSEETVALDVVAGPTITQVKFSLKDSYAAALDAIVSYINNGTTNYHWYVTPRRTLKFEQVGATAAPWNISESDASDGNIISEVSNTITREKFTNSVLVDIGNSQSATTLLASFIGDGSARSFDTQYPIAAPPTIDLYVLGTNVPIPQTVGLTGDPLTGTGKDWYWSLGSTSLVQDSGATPMDSGHFISVEYSALVKISQRYEYTASATARAAIEGGSGKYESAISTDGAPILAGTDIAESTAKYHAALSQSIEVTTFRSGLKPGMSLTCVIAAVSASGTYIVDKVALSTPNNIAEWRVSLVAGAVIGDWLKAFKGIGGGGASGTQAVGMAATSGAVSVDGYYVITPVAGVATVDLANGKTQVVVLDDAGGALNIAAPIFTGGALDGSSKFRLYIQTPASGTWVTPTFTGGADGFNSAISSGAAYSTSPVPNYDVRDCIDFEFHGAGSTWSHDLRTMGVPIA